jgi:hypothetical protein
MHLATLARSAGFAARAGSQNILFARPNPDLKNQKRRSDAELPHYLLRTPKVYMLSQFITQEGICLQRVYLMENSEKRVLVVAASEALKDSNFRAAMDNEISAFRENDSIEEICLADLDDSVNAVKFSTRWVFTIKKGMTETRFKARLVARE